MVHLSVCILIILLFYKPLQIETTNKLNSPELLLVTVATEETDGLRRLRKSSDKFGHKLHIFGLGEQWNGGDMHYMGGAQKVKILYNNLREYIDRENLLILFVDAYDVIINADSETILRKFFLNFHDKKIVFGAESHCWPDSTLARKYPPVVFGERYLNSGMFIGFAKEIVQMLKISEQQELADDDDDQLFYTKIYLSETRDNLAITLDSLSSIFQNLNGAQEFVTLQFEKGHDTMVYNTLYNTHPIIIHGNGPTKLRLNELGNYLVTNYDYMEQQAFLDESENDLLPVICISVFIMKPTPYVEEFFDALIRLDYPKEKINLYITNNQPYNQHFIQKFADDWEESFVSLELSNLNIEKEHITRSSSFVWAQRIKAKYLLIIDADAHLTNKMALKFLINKADNNENYLGIISPLLIRHGTLYSNFWGAVSDSGYYARSFDYVDVVEGKRRGIWNVPFVGSAIFISQRKFAVLENAYVWKMSLDADISFTEFCRDQGHFLYIDAMEGPDFYGFLVNTDSFSQIIEKAYINNEIYDYPNNRKLWENRYIHPEYFSLPELKAQIPMACPDVYDFPFLSKRFCKEIIEIMENFGQWSGGTHEDKRIQGGYENVPTRDIHMNQVGLERQWLKILDEYIAPLQEQVFLGYYQRPVQSTMMFVVRYRPDEQAFLRPHHDASTYSIDVALNKRGVDFEGGGVHYIRYNCTAKADEIGWAMMFPGRLTHLHEGLETTNGTRYILVSFINP